MQSRAQPKEVLTENPSREYKIKDNGDVELVETIKNNITYSGREFLTFIRDHEEVKKQIEIELSDERKKKLNEDLINISKDIEELTSMKEEIDKKLKEEFERVKDERMLTYFREQIDKVKKFDEIKKLLSWWDGVPSSVKDKITKEESKKLLEMKLKSKRSP